MRYVLLICVDQDDASSGAEGLELEFAAFQDELEPRGVVKDHVRLRPTSFATTVRMRDHQMVVADGPFAETREQLGGYCLIDALNLDEAIAIAEKIPGVQWGTIEIRPVMEIPGLPKS